ncbi:MAG: BON domain-containing protein [Egibacteraceae bacterium]
MRKSVITAAARERAEETARKLRKAEMGQRATELGAKLQARGADLAAKAQPTLEELTEKAQAKGEELAAKAQPMAEDLAARAQAKTFQLANSAQARGGELADRGLRQVGERLSRGRVAERLGIQPTARTFPWWLAGLLGIGAGYAIGILTARRGTKFGVDAFSAARPLADTIRAEITKDPRTAGLPDLRVDVSNGTVFVRGTVPHDFDQDTLREVIELVPGVHDVDLQVSGR